MNYKTSFTVDRRTVIPIRNSSTIYDKMKRINAQQRQKKSKEEK